MTVPDLPQPLACKVVFIGDAGVGKTCIIRAARGLAFNPNTNPTIGTGFEKLPMSRNSRNVIFEIWDTAGQERFQALTKCFFKGANAAIFVMDLTRQETITPLSGYLEQLCECCVENDVVIILIGNKADLTTERAITLHDAEVARQSLKASSYIETSAVTGQNVLEIFERLADNPDLKFANPMGTVVAFARASAENSSCNC
jgi:small GTP-binding protein